MSEMLGNQFFLARRYSDARAELERELEKDSTNLPVLKKLIICYLQTDQIEKAFQSFYSLVKQNVEIIIDTDPIRDDCPCPEIIDELKEEMQLKGGDDEVIKLGILWLYCDKDVSTEYFLKVSHENEKHHFIQEIISIINGVKTKLTRSDYEQ